MSRPLTTVITPLLTCSVQSFASPASSLKSRLHSCRYCGGRIGVALTTTAFVLMMVLLLQPKKPRFSQFTTTVFGLFYTSYLPVFWVKLRMLSVPAINSSECQLELALSVIYYQRRAVWTAIRSETAAGALCSDPCDAVYSSFS
jgi:Na+/melibiose symporter-like transporter